MEKRRLFAAMVGVNRARAWLESTKSNGMALGLENTASAIAALELPQPAYETVHVAGSNGKGTTVATLGAALNRADLSHVAFTSPHLVRVEERVRVNGRPVAAVVFDNALAKVHAMAATTGHPLTFSRRPCWSHWSSLLMSSPTCSCWRPALAGVWTPHAPCRPMSPLSRP